MQMIRMRNLCCVCVACGSVLSGVSDDKVEFGEQAWKDAEIRFVSSLDGTRQPAYLCRGGGGEEPVPLFVVLHSWSFGYTMLDPATWGRQEAFRRGWAFLYPHFRGPNNTPEGCGSDLAVQDIVDAVEYAKAHLRIDARRIYLLGGSGGGHMALLMAGRHPEIWAGVYAACPITDVARWYRESKDPERNLWPHYGDMIARCCGGTPDEHADEYARRSPLTHLPAARSVPVDIITGVHDGHRLPKGGGSVPCGHAIRAFNCLAEAGDRLSEDWIATVERTEQVPEKDRYAGSSPYFAPDKAILLRHRSGNVRLTLFDAGHAGNYREGAEWLSHQRKGDPAVWNYGNMSAPCPDGTKEITR